MTFLHTPNRDEFLRFPMQRTGCYCCYCPQPRSRLLRADRPNHVAKIESELVAQSWWHRGAVAVRGANEPSSRCVCEWLVVLGILVSMLLPTELNRLTDTIRRSGSFEQPNKRSKPESHTRFPNLEASGPTYVGSMLLKRY